MDSLKWGSRGLDSRPFAVQRHNLLVYLSFLLSMLLRSHEESLFIAVNFAKVAKPDYTLPYRLPRAPYSPPAHLDDASTLPLRLNRRATPFSVTRATTTGATSSSRCPLLQYSPRRARHRRQQYLGRPLYTVSRQQAARGPTPRRSAA